MRESEFVKIAKALANPTRVRMLHEIRRLGSLNCSQICGCFALSQPTISHHVKMLEGAGLITVRRQGQYHVLTACDERLSEFTGAVEGRVPMVGGGEKAGSGIPARGAEKRKGAPK